MVWIGDYQQNGGPEAVYFSRSTDPEGAASFRGKTSRIKPANSHQCRRSRDYQRGFPQIVTESSGAIDVIWQQASAANPNGAYDILLARSTDGATFQKFTMDSAPTAAANTGQVAADA